MRPISKMTFSKAGICVRVTRGQLPRPRQQITPLALHRGLFEAHGPFLQPWREIVPEDCWDVLCDEKGRMLGKLTWPSEQAVTMDAVFFVATVKGGFPSLWRPLSPMDSWGGMGGSRRTADVASIHPATNRIARGRPVPYPQPARIQAAILQSPRIHREPAAVARAKGRGVLVDRLAHGGPFFLSCPRRWRCEPKQA